MERRRIYLQKFDSKDELNPTDEPNPTHLESLGQGNARPNFFELADGLAPKLSHLGCHME